MMRFNLFLVALLRALVVESAYVYIDLGTAGTFGALSAASITNTGGTRINGDLGTSGTTITGFPPGIYTGTRYLGDQATTAQSDAVAAYDALGRVGEQLVLVGNLGNRVLPPGIYKYTTSAQITGILTLAGTGSPTDAWYFQIGSTFVTSVGSTVILTGGAKPCNVFWRVGSSATLGVASRLSGTVFAQVSITANSGVTSDGGLFALGGSISLNNAVVSAQQCANPVPQSSSTSAVVSTSSIALTSSTESISSTLLTSLTLSTSSTMSSSSASSNAISSSLAASDITSSLGSSSASAPVFSSTTATSEPSSSTTTSLGSTTSSLVASSTTPSGTPISSTVSSVSTTSSLSSTTTSITAPVTSTTTGSTSSSLIAPSSRISTSVSSSSSISPIISSTTSSLSTSPSPSSAWGYSGCYTEANGERALSAASFASDQLTIERCATFCASFPIFGVEYGRECYCGSALGPGSIKVPEGDCNFKCAGSSTENCGAGNRLNVYKKPVASTMTSASPSSTLSPALPTSYGALGCYTEATEHRALKDKSSSDDAMTVEKCAASCAGFKYFGLEYYFECFCGNELQPGSVQVASTECKFPCKGDKTETCGANSRLNLYGFGDASSTPIPVSSSTTTTTPSATSYPGYTTTGCYTEATNIRALSEGKYCDDNMTVGMCALACSGFTLFGVEYGRECYCGSSLNAGSVSAPIQECNFACPGNKKEFCGAGNRLNVYKYGPDRTNL